jgi:diguanylate cyclase (GGDEF)-like protein
MIRKSANFIGFSLLILLALIGCMHFLFRFTPSHPILKLDKGWTVTYRNQQYINTNLEELSDQVGSSFSRGDTIVMNLARPLTYEAVPFPYIIFKTHYCCYYVYLDEELIASEFNDSYMKNDFVGVGYHSVPLPADFSGKKLSIKLVVTENGTRADVKSPLVGDYDDLYRYINHPVLLAAFIGIFLIIFGQVFLIISLLFTIKTSGTATQVICSILSSCLGMWMITAYDVVDFVVDCRFATVAEFSSLYLIVPLMYLLLFNLHKRYDNRVITFLGYATLAFSVLFMFLNGFNVVHINQFKGPYFVLSSLGFCALLFYDYMDIKDHMKNSSSKILMIGLNVLAFTLMIYMLSNIFKVTVDYRQYFIMCVILPGGCILFVTAQLLNHFIFMTRSFAQRKEYASLTQIAYIDNLTGIPNRVSCEKKLSEIETTNYDFCLLSLDLNGLKEVNDNSGHPAGDRLLKSFADCLGSVFDPFGSCFRVGGDEFLVIFTQIEKATLDTLLEDLDKKLKDLDETDPEANHSVSYGYAFRSEADEKDTHTVYMMADKRMYEYKRKYYSHMTTR